MAHPPYDPYYIHYQPPQPQLHDNSGIKTLFVSGLPDDVKAREIHNLFRRRPGFESCQLKYTGRGNQVVAFATFVNHQSAMEALISLNGVKFDPQTGYILHIELAKTNSRRKRKPGSGVYVVIDNRSKKGDNNRERETSSNDGGSDSEEPSDAENQDSGNKGDSVTSKSGETVNASDNAVAASNQQSENTVEGGQCSTLFIANLGPNCTEDELKSVLSKYPGFNMLKLRARGGMPVAFADFGGIEQANKAMEELHGSSLPSSDRGGMHIEYARSKMRKK
ncbi:hypothetical protein CsatB_012275 [Cannabis sativa]|uniref:protein WHI4 isoform X1 n=1 Tax=Cannabis sativa TaxID=3483 RepID=UPI0029C9BF46|nr:protein WHI4 isoform X1 [Cannabis sativa]